MGNLVSLANRQETCDNQDMTIETKDVVRWMKELRDRRDDLADAEERGKEYLAQCRAEVEQDIEPIRQSVEKLQEMLTVFIEEEHGGEKYKVPGVGTVYLTHRTTPKIVDEEKLQEAIKRRNPLKLATIQKVSLDRVKAQKYAKEIIDSEGEVLPGIEITHTKAISLRK